MTDSKLFKPKPTLHSDTYGENIVIERLLNSIIEERRNMIQEAKKMDNINSLSVCKIVCCKTARSAVENFLLELKVSQENIENTKSVIKYLEKKIYERGHHLEERYIVATALIISTDLTVSNLFKLSGGHGILLKKLYQIGFRKGFEERILNELKIRSYSVMKEYFEITNKIGEENIDSALVDNRNLHSPLRYNWKGTNIQVLFCEGNRRQSIVDLNSIFLTENRNNYIEFRVSFPNLDQYNNFRYIIPKTYGFRESSRDFYYYRLICVKYLTEGMIPKILSIIDYLKRYFGECIECQ